MKREAIQSGKTYIGRDGKHRTVTHVVAVGRRWEVFTIDHEKNCTSACGMSQFANWAVREDTSGEPMAKWNADRAAHQEKFQARQRKEEK